MDIFMESPAGDDEGRGLFFDDLMTDSQISELELSSQLLGRTRPSSASTPSSSRPSSGIPSYKPTPPRPPTIARRAAPQPAPIRHQTEQLFDKRVTSSSTRNRHIRHDSSTSVDSWESDADLVDPRQVPRQPNESQQDLAERIANLTRTINANAAFCVEVSSKMIELARENKHLLDASRSTLETYILQPALKIPGILKQYYPGIQDGLQDGLDTLREYEVQLRRTVQNVANGRDMVRAQGVNGVAVEGASRRGEMTRLKDRLVEQDALLRDSSQHVQRLIRERETLKKQLHKRTRSGSGHEAAMMGLGMADTDKVPFLRLDVDEEHSDDGREDQPNSEKDMVALADHLREMRVLMDRLAIHEQTSNHERRHSNSKPDDIGKELAADDEDPEWTLL
ncbi:hypothetical protein BKA67DRAFT_539477 [Truncatella angustata]|uniref:Uncharacterized protein n=1 Tax=Truncatella angustata TaxID=152316 RepID=A0A9P8RKQ7_9PEZI|nr:uncharacterized protein BKA67DRAFT_539477 [Truncatella angustata]KAH6647626.1 hypothetical protein BKA67DRAFT_539477 [Truncatella angustata]